MYRILFVILCLCMLCACNNDLSRSSASSQIKEKADYLSTRYIITPEGNLERPNFEPNALSSKQEKLLMDNNLFDNNNGKIGLSDYTPTDCYKIEEEKNIIGQKVQVVNVYLGKVDDVTIENITKPADFLGKKVCEATFTINYKKTEVGEVANIDDKLLSKDGAALFIETDKGWKLDSIKYK